MWDLPRPGIEPMSPALAGGLSTTGPPGESLFGFLLLSFVSSLFILDCDIMMYKLIQKPKIYFSYIFCLHVQFLAHNSQNPWDFLSVESDKGAFCYVKEITFRST